MCSADHNTSFGGKKKKNALMDCQQRVFNSAHISRRSNGRTYSHWSRGNAPGWGQLLINKTEGRYQNYPSSLQTSCWPRCYFVFLGGVPRSNSVFVDWMKCAATTENNVNVEPQRQLLTGITNPHDWLWSTQIHPLQFSGRNCPLRQHINKKKKKKDQRKG